MKKVIIIFSLVILVILSTVTTLLLINKKNNSKSDNNIIAEEDAFSDDDVNNFEEEKKISQVELLWTEKLFEAQEIATAYGLEVVSLDEKNSESGENMYVNGAAIGGIPIQIFYQIGENENIVETKGVMVPFREEYIKAKEKNEEVKLHSGKDLKVETEKIINLLGEMFSADVSDKYGIYTSNEMISNDEAGFNSIVDGTATLSFSLRDWSGGYWNLHSFQAEDGVVCYELLHLPACDDNSKDYVDIDLSGDAEE